MSGTVEKLNRAVEEASPALAHALSPLGRRAAFPRDVPFQAAQAREARFNATIGQITDGEGTIEALPTLWSRLEPLAPADRNRAFLYSPVEGIPEVRRRWRDWQRRGQPAERPSTLPVVTVGLTHGVSVVADLFVGEGSAAVVPAPFWGNYRQIFAVRNGGRVLPAPAFCDGRFDPGTVGRAAAELPAGEPLVAVLNFPSNPAGYSPTDEERRALADDLAAVAAERPVVALCDDAYAGLVYDETIERASIFWDLIGVHPNLVPVKVDGATKEFCFFGGRVGFVTFPFEPDSEIAAALESKVKYCVRASVGSPVAASQMILLEALREERIEEETEAMRRLLEERYGVLMEALAGVDRELLRPLPCNSGSFALVELTEALGLDAETVRQHLLREEDVGLIAVPPRYLRIAFCSVKPSALPELVERLERGVRTLVAGRSG